jgi:hypothetical protein
MNERASSPSAGPDEKEITQSKREKEAISKAPNFQSFAHCELA